MNSSGGGGGRLELVVENKKGAKEKGAKVPKQTVGVGQLGCPLARPCNGSYPNQDVDHPPSRLCLTPVNSIMH